MAKKVVKKAVKKIVKKAVAKNKPVKRPVKVEPEVLMRIDLDDKKVRIITSKRILTYGLKHKGSQVWLGVL